MAKKISTEILTLNEADFVMQLINDYDRLLSQHYEEESNAVAEVRAKFHNGKCGVKLAKWKHEKKIQIKRLEKFSKKNRKEWKQKSIETAFGTFGFRKGQPCVVLIKKVCKNFEEALERVKNRFPDLVRQKEEINKEKILQLNHRVFSKENLEAVGLKIDSGEKFFIKTRYEERLEEASKKLKSA